MAHGEGCLRSRAPSADALRYSLRGFWTPPRPPQPSWAHLRKVGMSRTGTLRVRALTRRFRSSVSSTTSRSKRMGSSGEGGKRQSGVKPGPDLPQPSCPSHAKLPPPCAKMGHERPKKRSHPAPRRCAQLPADSPSPLRPFSPPCRGSGLIFELCPQPGRRAATLAAAGSWCCYSGDLITRSKPEPCFFFCFFVFLRRFSEEPPTPRRFWRRLRQAERAEA